MGWDVPHCAWNRPSRTRQIARLKAGSWTTDCRCRVEAIQEHGVNRARSQRQAILGKHISDSFDLSADGLEFFFDFFVAAVDVVDAVDDGFTVRD